jgi:hypothetical protein
MSMKLPAAHLVQLPCFGWSLKVPALQLVASAEPTGQNVPSGHTVHLSWLFIAPTKSTGLAVPRGQGNGAAEPFSQ